MACSLEFQQYNLVFKYRPVKEATIPYALLRRSDYLGIVGIMPRLAEYRPIMPPAVLSAERFQFVKRRVTKLESKKFNRDALNLLEESSWDSSYYIELF
jgi:hypothetical protein